MRLRAEGTPEKGFPTYSRCAGPGAGHNLQLLGKGCVLTASCLIVADPAVPQQTGGGRGDADPKKLQGKPLPQGGGIKSLKEDLDWEEKLVGERRPGEERPDAGRKQVQREDMAAQEVLKRVENENER